MESIDEPRKSNFLHTEGKKIAMESVFATLSLWNMSSRLMGLYLFDLGLFSHSLLAPG